MSVEGEPIATTLQYEIDPVCDAAVESAESLEHGLAVEYRDRDYVFCSAACREAFVHDPDRFATTGQSAPPVRTLLRQ